MKPAIAEAIRLVQTGTHTVYAAAKLCRVAQSSVHRAIKREATRCVTCGQRRPTLVDDLEGRN